LVTNLNQKQDHQFMHRFQYSGKTYTGSQHSPFLSGRGGSLAVVQ